MTFSSSSFGQLRYIQESVRGVTPTSGNSIELRMTQPTLQASISAVKSAEIRKDRLSSGNTRTDMDVDGGFNFELSVAEYDPFLEGLLGGAFTHYGTGGLGTEFSMTSTANKITAGAAPTGGSAFTTLSAGQWIKVVPPTAATGSVKTYFANTWFKVLSVTATEVTLDPSTPIVAPGIVSGVAGYAISRSQLVNGSTRKTFSIEHDLSDVGSKLLYTGLEANTMELNIEVGSIITGSFGFIGQGHKAKDGASFLPGTPVASKSNEIMNAVTDVGYVLEGGSNLLANGSFIQSISLSVNNNARGQKAVGVFGNAGVGLGEMELGGNLQVYFEDATYYQKWLAGTSTSLAFGVSDSAGNGYMIELDKVKFREGGLNSGGNGEDVMLDLPFDAFFNAATNRGIRITRAVVA